MTNTNDSGAGSLHQAITNANSTAGTQTISFNIAGDAPFKITPAQPLPIIRDSVVIDATTQPGFGGAPIVELSGESGLPGNTTGLETNVNATTIKGLVINRWAYGIRLRGFGNVIQKNYIGTDVSGNVAQANGYGIIVLSGSYDIGGTATEGNLISGNQSAGIVSLTSDSTISTHQRKFHRNQSRRRFRSWQRR